MGYIRPIITSAVITALAVAALAGPAATASKGRVAFVNGVPGKNVDVCLGQSNEIRSKLPYGGVFRAQLGGTKKLVFRVAGRGTCKGKPVASRRVTFAAGSDTTIVATSNAPKVLVFDNSKLGTLAADDPDGALAMRHAADLTANSVYFRYTFWKDPFVKDNPVTPAADELFSKGDEYVGPLFVEPDLIMRTTATRADPTVVVARSPLVGIETLKRYEFILIGTKAANAKLLAVISKLSAPPPPLA